MESEPWQFEMCIRDRFYRVNNDQNRTNYGSDESCVVYNIAYRISTIPAVMVPAPAVPASEEKLSRLLVDTTRTI